MTDSLKMIISKNVKDIGQVDVASNGREAIRKPLILDQILYLWIFICQV